jgi:beta-xylosidase
MQRPLRFLLCLLAGLAAAGARAGEHVAWGDQGDGMFRNPILPADFSDLDAVRVGADYYAISSTLHQSPGMVVLHARDLVNWQIVGHVVADVTALSPEMNWDRMNRYGRGVWAGAIRHHAGRFWVYFGTPDEGYFMSTATNAAGPWAPVAHVMKQAGWDDCCPFWDDDGQGYLIGTDFKHDCQIHLFKLTPDGRGLLPGYDVVLHRSQHREANKLYKWNGEYFHFFSEVNREGRVPMIGRAKRIEGPYEYRQLLHVDPKVDREPNQGAILQTAQGDWWFLTHQGTGAYEGRAMCLIPVTWRDGWPLVGEIGPDGIGRMPWQVRKPLPGSARVRLQTDDDFAAPALGVQWEWNHQPRDGMWSLAERPGWLRLRAFPARARGQLLRTGNVLTQRLIGTNGGEAVVTLDVAGLVDGQLAGLAQYSRTYAWLGVAQSGGVRRIVWCLDGARTDGPVLEGHVVHLKTILAVDGTATWAWGTDGTNFASFGGRYRLAWGNYRGSRFGLFTCNDEAEAGFVDIDAFRYRFPEPGGAAAGAAVR